MLSRAAGLFVVVTSLVAGACGAHDDPEHHDTKDVGEGEGEAVGEEGEGEAVGEEGEGEAVGEEGEGEGEDVVVVGDLRVLLIGNSQLGFFGSNPQPPDVTRALEDVSGVAYDGASHLVVDKAQIDGTGCDGWAAAGLDPGTPKERAGSGDYDVVVLLPSIGERSASAACWELFRDIAENAGAEFVVMATANVSFQYPAGFDDLDAAVRGYAEGNGLRFIPAGAAWRRVLGQSPSSDNLAEMYGGDGAHPGPEGSYFYVLALYAGLTGRSAVGLPVDSEPLRCQPGQSCLSYDGLDACVGDNGDFNCAAQNGAQFDPNHHVSFITAAEAGLYQQSVDAVLSER
jgi:hypothetical protein